VQPDGSIAFAYDPAIAQGFAADDGTDPPDLWPLWQALDAKPVLLVRGALSDLLTADTALRMKQAHQGVFVQVDVPRRGHPPVLDEPEVLPAIREFLARHAAG